MATTANTPAITPPREDAGRVLDQNDPGVAARYKLNDIYCAAWLSHAISALAEHRIPDFLPADSPRHFTELAAQANLHPPTLYRALRALAANGIFQEVGEGKFAHNSTSLLLRSDHADSWSGMAKMWNHPSCLQAWLNHRNSLKDGRSGIEHAFGKPLYGHLADFPEATKAFSDAMISNSAHASKSIARQFPFEKYASVMDLGGGVGTLLLEILRTHPHLKGTLFEIGELEELARQNIADHQLSERCDFVRGDWFSYVPQGSELYLVKNSMWNWNDEKCLAIMTNVRKAIATTPGARFVIIEYIIDNANQRWTTAYDLQILNMPGGRARTETEYRELLATAGFAVEMTQYIEDQTLVISMPN